MRMSESLGDRIRSLVSEQLGVDRAELSATAKILDDLGADSLDVVELVMALEEAFDIEIPDEDAELMNTIGDVEAYVTKRVAS
jgi:acyl carrier protein